MPTTITDPLARTYARSLLELADEQNSTPAVAADVAALRDVLDQTPTLVRFLSDPGIPAQDRRRVLDQTLGQSAEPLLVRTVGVLNSKHRLNLLPDMLDAFEQLLDERLGKVEVDVTVPRRMNDEQLESVRRQISAAMGKDAVVHQYVDESILGGIVLRVGDTIIDGSVKAQLDAVKDRLLAGRQ